ncbi:HEAT repeat domain-containing protein [Nocardioides sp. HDW12B]|uniref:HEAT repeat domain-containing protein n=1 Tax=Nocardioides sp. HDW12B TaxID=2714939 RepID=UPI00140E036C|nr:HEAT repeat domain-containing protein [Nocardioides sp. HDW12B]QIK66322.1 HEAT repeat domain-containing protein [Nocardioides sp. HDW12B]
MVPVSDPPRSRVHAAVREHGEAAVVGWCTELLRGSGPHGVPREGALVLGGRHGVALLADPGGDHAWWWQVWGARGLLHAWHPDAVGPVLAALDHQQWRVREGALRVVARRRLDHDLQRVADRQDDPVARVRAAAGRALARIEAADRQPATAGSSVSSSHARTGQSSAASADRGSPSNART